MQSLLSQHDKPFNDAAHRAVTAIDLWLDSILHHSQSPDLTAAQFLSKCRTDAQREVHPPSFYPPSSWAPSLQQTRSHALANNNIVRLCYCGRIHCGPSVRMRGRP